MWVKRYTQGFLCMHNIYTSSLPERQSDTLAAQGRILHNHFFCMLQLNRLPSAICQQQDSITIQSFLELFQLAVSSKSENRKTVPQDALMQFFFC